MALGAPAVSGRRRFVHSGKLKDMRPDGSAEPCPAKRSIDQNTWVRPCRFARCPRSVPARRRLRRRHRRQEPPACPRPQSPRTSAVITRYWPQIWCFSSLFQLILGSTLLRLNHCVPRLKWLLRSPDCLGSGAQSSTCFIGAFIRAAGMTFNRPPLELLRLVHQPGAVFVPSKCPHFVVGKHGGSTAMKFIGFSYPWPLPVTNFG